MNMYLMWMAFSCILSLTTGEEMDTKEQQGGDSKNLNFPLDDKAYLKMEILNVLGLDLPADSDEDVDKFEKNIKNTSASIYMKNIYSVVDNGGDSPNLQKDYDPAAGSVNTIVTYMHKDYFLSLDSHDHTYHSSNSELKFDLSDVLTTFNFVEAKLRVYRKALENPRKEELQLMIYKNSPVRRFDDKATSELTLPDAGWVSLDITNIVKDWISYSSPNLGIRFVIQTVKDGRKVHLDDAGIVGAKGDLQLLPFLVCFYERPNVESPPLLNFLTDYTNLSEGKEETDTGFVEIVADDPASIDHNSCQKYSLYVSFKDLSWNKWLIAPHGYEANFCAGSCSFSRLNNLNVTNHAIVQTLSKIRKAYNTDDKEPPHASCAPKVLSTITILYVSYSRNVVLKKYPNMIVEECGCA